MPPKFKQPSKRAAALARLKYAGYHNDYSTFVRVYVENRISYPNAISQYRAGIQARTAGIRCNCQECNPTPAPNPLQTPTG
jgi:hypothetical protein